MTHPGETTAPIQSADLSGVIERLEMAAKPNRYDDCHLWVVAKGGDARMVVCDSSEKSFVWERGIDGMWIRSVVEFREVPKYTASVDAAIALAERVLPGCDISASDIHGDFRQAGEHRHTVDVMADLQWRTYDAYPEPVYSINGSATAPTRALAICLATLRALLSNDRNSTDDKD